MADGALRSDILRVLKEAQVEVSDLPEQRYRLCKGETVLVVRLQETISGTTVDKISRRFTIPKARFYPANAPKVVPIDRGKASGEQE